MASATEQGRNLADLNVRFAVFQSVGFLIGKGFQLRSPIVHNIADFAKLRNCFEPFRQYVKNLGSTSMYCYCSPAHLQDAWEEFLGAVAFAWKIAGVDSSRYIQKLRTYHQATASVRSRHLYKLGRGNTCPSMIRSIISSTAGRVCEKSRVTVRSKESGSKWPCMIRTSIVRRDSECP